MLTSTGKAIVWRATYHAFGEKALTITGGYKTAAKP